MKPDEPGYEVGYGKPPKATRFSKGESGNPKGRPKGKLNIATVLARTLEEPVVINENGQRKTITKLEAVVKQLVNKAASGDLAATKQLLSGLVRTCEEGAAAEAAPVQVLTDVDQKVVEGVLQRMQMRLLAKAENTNGSINQGGGGRS